MYVTKIIERFGDSAMIANSIDELCNKMFKEGYMLVTYQFYGSNEKILLTFKKEDKEKQIPKNRQKMPV